MFQWKKGFSVSLNINVNMRLTILFELLFFVTLQVA